MRSAAIFHNPAVLSPALGHTICAAAEAIQSVTVWLRERKEPERLAPDVYSSVKFLQRSSAVAASQQKMVLSHERNCKGVGIPHPFVLCKNCSGEESRVENTVKNTVTL